VSPVPSSSASDTVREGSPCPAAVTRCDAAVTRGSVVGALGGALWQRPSHNALRGPLPIVTHALSRIAS